MTPPCWFARLMHERRSSPGPSPSLRSGVPGAKGSTSPGPSSKTPQPRRPRGTAGALIALICLGCVPGGVTQQIAEKPLSPQPEGGLREVFPGVRADVKAKLVEFDGEVPIDCHSPETPLVYLEVMVCTPDTKEHESLVMTRAKPSHVHAALLACGLTPGKPGSWSWNAAEKKMESIPPEGAPLRVSIAHADASGKEVEALASDWVLGAKGSEPFKPKDPSQPGWAFAGSKMAVRSGAEVYDADGTGTLVGLTTFGAETIAWRDVLSHEAAVHEPEWVANAKLVPKVGTKVVVRIRAAEPPSPATPGERP